MQTTTRNATLEDLASLLKDQHARKVDVVAPATAIRSKGGVLHVKGAEAEISEDGVTTTDGRYLPTSVCDEGIAEKLGIPLPYVRRLRNERPDLYDSNVNGLLHGRHRLVAGLPGDADAKYETVHAPDSRKFLLRAFRGDDGEVGIARALLSQQYKMIDNLDVLMAALAGVKDAGVNVNIDGCDLTDRRMYVRLVAPEVAALAPVLLRNYSNPFSDPAVERAQNRGWTLQQGRDAAQREGRAYGEGEEPIVFAGFMVSNSETGGGAFSIVPRLMVKVCQNGLVITKDALRSVHLGSKMEEGIVRWSDDTQQKNLALVTAQTRDAVSTFLDVDYVTRAIERIEEQSEKRIEGNPADAVKQVGKRLAFSQGAIDGMLEHFVRGGQMTAGGVLNAVTSYAQTVDDADVAMDLEGQALRALEVAATL